MGENRLPFHFHPRSGKAKRGVVVNGKKPVGIMAEKAPDPERCTGETVLLAAEHRTPDVVRPPERRWVSEPGPLESCAGVTL